MPAPGGGAKEMLMGYGIFMEDVDGIWLTSALVNLLTLWFAARFLSGLYSLRSRCPGRAMSEGSREGYYIWNPNDPSLG